MKDTITFRSDVDWGSFLTYYKMVDTSASLYGHSLNKLICGDAVYIDSSNTSSRLIKSEPTPIKKKRSLNSVIAYYYARKQKG